MPAEFIVYDREHVVEQLEMTDEQFEEAVERGCEVGQAITLANFLGKFCIVERVQRPNWDVKGFILLSLVPLQ